MLKRMFLFFLFGALLVVSQPTLATVAEVRENFSQGRYEDARLGLADLQDGPGNGDDILWRCRLESDPRQVESLLEQGLKQQDLTLDTRIGLAIQLAQIHFARGEFEKVHDNLSSLVAGPAQSLPGEIFLLLGLAQRAGGQLQSAREMLASVKPQDPAFTEARYYLGEIGLQSDDPELALRYFESGLKNSNQENASRLQAGRWMALRALGQDGAAQKILDRLEEKAPDSLALVEIRRAVQEEKDDRAAQAATVGAGQVPQVIPAEEKSNYFSLQVGAFSDRSLALEFQKKHRRDIPGLRIFQERDARGQFIYKLRFGSFVSPAEARSEAKRQQHKLGIEVIVVDLNSSSAPGR